MEIQIFGVLQNRGIPVVCNVVFALHFRPPQNIDCVGGFKGFANIGQSIIPFTFTTGGARRQWELLEVY
jgi:hypothetical protein